MTSPDLLAFVRQVRAKAAELRARGGAAGVHPSELVAMLRARSEWLRRERDGPGSREGAGELGEDRQVGVKAYPIQSPDPKR